MNRHMYTRKLDYWKVIRELMRAFRGRVNVLLAGELAGADRWPSRYISPSHETAYLD